MGRIMSINLSPARGTRKEKTPEALFIRGHGIEGDAHAGDWHRQVSILPWERIEEFRAKGAEVSDGDFGENLVVRGIDFSGLAVGSRIRCAGALLELTQFGKECHSRCSIYAKMGDCVMPREGVFAKVVEGGLVREGDEAEVLGQQGNA